MKIGIMTDLHMEFEENSTFDFDPEPDVFYICAGDINTSRKGLRKFTDKHADHMCYVLGNHDYWGHNLGSPYDSMYTKQVGDIKIAGATLWTEISNPINWMTYRDMMNDHSRIYGMGYDSYNIAHITHREFLFNSGADIIVSHHAPSYISLKKDERNSLDFAYATEFFDRIYDMKNPPKLWIHGHTHFPVDYLIGKTRIINHPLGYPGINYPTYSFYKPLIVEI